MSNKNEDTEFQQGLVKYSAKRVNGCLAVLFGAFGILLVFVPKLRIVEPYFAVSPSDHAFYLAIFFLLIAGGASIDKVVEIFAKIVSKN